MHLRNLGPSGLRVSVVGLGCNNFGGRIDLEASRATVHKALDLGITLLDTADIYGNQGGSETALGQILGPRRKDIVLATKFGMKMDQEGLMMGGARRYIMTAVEASLKRLKTDYIDLYQLHQPDPLTPIEETLATLDVLVKSGKVHYIGCSNLPGWQVADAHWTAKTRGLTPFVSAQDEYSLLVRDHEKQLFPALKHYGMGLLPFFPLACGMLTGKYERGRPMPEGSRLVAMPARADQYMTAANWDIVDKLTKYARERGHTLLDLAFSWLVHKAPVTSVIAGATSPAQVEANVKAAGWKLIETEIADVDRLAQK